ncbi:hypothetical protein ACFL6X_06115 [Candidatus Latescibacterota bacterium]
MMDRRQFLAVSAGLLAGGLPVPATARKKRIAFLGSVVHKYSHAQHFLDRLTLGQAWGGRWLEPRVEVASVYLDQFPEEDLGRERIARHGLKRYPTIAEALCLGGSSLAVDGVVIIAEHGDYPRNDKRQKRYPRYEWFKEVVEVFEASGRAVPVFNDKHLSTVWDECVEMVADSQRLGFPFLAGSSLPVTWRLPSVDVPYGAGMSESVCVAYGGRDSYDIHALETAQCMSERRRGGEVGISQVLALRGERMWEHLAAEERRRTRDLVMAALTRSHNLPVEGGYPTGAVTFDWARNSLGRSFAYFIEHRDGFRTSIVMTGIRDFNYAGYLTDTNEILSCQMYLPMPERGSTTADFFNPQVRHIEDMILSGRAPYPVERTLLTSGMVIGGIESYYQEQRPYATPQMAVEYRGPEESLYWRA